MNELHKKPRKLRVERMGKSDTGTIHEGESWAVSYADMLMVLLSFFVVFFSIDDKGQKNDLIDIIAGVTRADGTSVAQKRGEASVGDKDSEVTVRVGDKVGAKLEGLAGLQSFVAGLDGFEAVTSSDGRKLVLNFPKDIYLPGKFVLQGDNLGQLDKVLGQINPYQKGIELSFVGHTDDVKVSKSKGKTLENNFDLSSLRASRALQRAIELGIAPASLSAKGGAEFSRNTRSLTVVVSMKQEGP